MYLCGGGEVSARYCMCSLETKLGLLGLAACTHLYLLALLICLNWCIF